MNGDNLTPRPPSLPEKGVAERRSPPLVGEGPGERSPNPPAPFPTREGGENRGRGQNWR